MLSTANDGTARCRNASTRVAASGACPRKAQAARKKAYTEAQSILACSGPVAHLTYGQLFKALRSNVQGFEMLANRSLMGLKNVSVSR